MRAPLDAHDPLGREQPAQLVGVDVAVHARQRRTDPLELAQHLDGREVAGVEQQVGARDALDEGVGQPPRAARHVGVGDDGDERSRVYTQPHPRP